jgi:hypothetical protein
MLACNAQLWSAAYNVILLQFAPLAWLAITYLEAHASLARL